MNIGAFGENFPYTNFHDLNLDWIIKIAKDFLDQYTNIQQTITDGLEALDNKAEELQGLLDEWYNTHSEDIANQLADALNDLNEWYNTHSEDIANELEDALGNISDALSSAITSFNTSATQKGEQVIQSIPSDYTEITEQIDNVENLLILSNRNTPYLLDLSYYTIADTMINGAGSGTTTLSGYNTTPYIPIYSEYEHFSGNAFPLEAYNSFVLYDADYNVLYKAHNAFDVSVQDYPTAKYFRASQNTTSQDLTVYVDNNQYQYMLDMLSIFTGSGMLPDSLLVNANKLMQGNGTVVSNMTGYYLSDYIPIFNRDMYFYGNFFEPLAYTTFVLYDDSYTPVYIAHGKQHINLGAYPTATYFRYGGNMVDLLTYIGQGTENITFNIGSTQFYTTLKAGIANAIKFKNSKVFVDAGEYNLATEFASEISAGSGSVGISLENNVYVTFSAGSYVKALFPSSNDYISTYFQPFRGYNFTLDGLNIESSNCRYCVHDEQASADYMYHNTYKNCIMKHTAHTSSGITNAYSQCIGGGLGKHGYIEIIGGMYTSIGDNASTPAISYHNGGLNGCDNRVFISGVYLGNNNNFQFASWGTQDKVSQFVVNNCSMGGAISETTVEAGGQDNIWITEWNNIIR